MFSARWPVWWFETAAGLVYPPHCAICAQPVGSARGGGVCRECLHKRIRLSGPRCAVCSQPYGGAITGEFRCMNCGDRELAFDFATSAYRSRGVVRELIHGLKYGRQLHLRHWLGRMLAEAFDDPRLETISIDGVVPVPLHPAKLREREFNQSLVLAREASRRRGLPMLDCLRRGRFTETQTHFHREERFANLSGAFEVRRGFEVGGKTLVLVDDVLTTGSTADSCARTLREAGAVAVVVITVARG
jgi:competence protein ComFC